MPDIPLHDKRADDEHIDLRDGTALRHWARHLGTDPERLRVAVAAVGTELQQLRRFLADPAPGVAQAATLLPDESPHDANGLAGVPHYDIHKEAS